MKIFSLFFCTILVSSVLVNNNAFSVDYRDSTGYTPSWAKDSGYHSVLIQCNELIGDTSRDGSWCMEWVANVLDQGIENFPESTKDAPTPKITTGLSERECVANKICAFEGEFLKYYHWDTFDDSSEIAIVEFKEKVNDDTMRFFSEGFGSKPLTYNLDLNTGIETHDQYNVNRPFNFVEPVPLEIGQKVYRIIGQFYDAEIIAEKTLNLKEMRLMDIQRTVMGAKIEFAEDDVGALTYDKESGILIAFAEKYMFEGKEYTSGSVLIDTNMFSGKTTIVPANEVQLSNTVIEQSSEIEKPSQDSKLTEASNDDQGEQKVSSTNTVDWSDPLYVFSFALGIFLVIGIPVIIIWLIIRKIRKRRANKLQAH